MHRLTYTIVSKVMDETGAKREFEYAKRNLPHDTQHSAAHLTIEVWDENRKAWVLQDRFDHENR